MAHFAAYRDTAGAQPVPQSNLDALSQESCDTHLSLVLRSRTSHVKRCTSVRETRFPIALIMLIGAVDQQSRV